MGKIKLMSPELANRIKAGEVIERPLNIVKELVENSLDANSSTIVIELTNAGIDKIKVVDNGDGILKDDLRNAVVLHATSKLDDRSDLFEIETLGFRGEALASMNGVSKVKITSSVDGINGFCLFEDEIHSASCNKGTIVEISDLFYNTPVRFKNLKSVHYELSLITSYIQKLSLINPNLNITLINDFKNIFSSNFKGNMDAIINNVYGVDVLKNKIDINFETNNFIVNGFIIKSSILRSHKRHIVITINGRIVSNIEIQKAIIEGYKNYLFTTNFPICLINIETNYDNVDVNIHPTKEKVRIQSISEVLMELPIVINNLLRNDVYEKIEKPVFVQSKIEDNTTKEVFYKNENLQVEMEVEKEEWKLPVFEYIGVYHKTYLLFGSEKGLYFADQHAMHERINYEKILRKLTNKNFTFQKLLIPLVITLDDVGFNEALKKIDSFEKIGFIVEEFGYNTIKVTEVDQIYSRLKIIENDITTLLNSRTSFEEMVDEIAIMMACKESIKANDYINNMEVDILLEQLNRCKHPHTCPHGRPIFVEINRYEIEKLFRRVG